MNSETINTTRCATQDYLFKVRSGEGPKIGIAILADKEVVPRAASHHVADRRGPDKPIKPRVGIIDRNVYYSGEKVGRSPGNMKITWRTYGHVFTVSYWYYPGPLRALRR